jgi:hypothetical protein
MKTIIFALMIKIWFLDVKTKETLPAVKVTTDKSTYYSNLDGFATIPNNEKIIKVTYNTYKTLNNINVSNDTTIYLNHFELNK